MDIGSPKYSGNTSERVFPYGDGFAVHGTDGKVWYMVSGDKASSADFSLMLKNEPDKIPFNINDKNIESWRQSMESSFTKE